MITTIYHKKVTAQVYNDVEAVDKHIEMLQAIKDNHGMSWPRTNLLFPDDTTKEEIAETAAYVNGYIHAKGGKV